MALDFNSLLSYRLIILSSFLRIKVLVKLRKEVYLGDLSLLNEALLKPILSY